MPPMVQIGSAYGGRGPKVLACAWIGLILSTVLVAGRLYLRVTKGAQAKYHDLALGLALYSYLTSMAGTCLLTVAVHYGLGNHTANLSFRNLVLALKYLWLSISQAAMTSGVSKASVVAFLLAMQHKSTLHKQWAWLLWVTALTNLALSIASVFIIVFQCVPAEATWDPMAKGNCYAREHLFAPVGITQGAWNSISDLVLAIYPVFIVYQLRIVKSLKVALCIILGLGVIAGAISFVRLYLLIKLKEHAPTDPLWQLSILSIWAWIECWILLIALSIPPVWPILKPYSIKLTSFISSASRRTGIISGSRQNGSASNSKDWKPQLASYTSGGSKRFTMPSQWGEQGRGIRATKDVIVVSEEMSERPLCSAHSNQSGLEP